MSRALAVLLGAAAIALGNYWVVMLAVMVWMMAGAERLTIERHEVLTRMGAWHPADVPWVRYDAAADRERASSAAGGSARAPDEVMPPSGWRRVS